MNNSSQCPCVISLKFFLILICASHLILGLLMTIPIVPIDRLASLFLNTHFTMTPVLEHVIQKFGIYMMTIGLMALFAISDPIKNRIVIDGLIFLLLAKTLWRLISASEASNIFGVSYGVYTSQTILLGVMAVGLILLRPKGISED